MSYNRAPDTLTVFTEPMCIATDPFKMCSLIHLEKQGALVAFHPCGMIRFANNIPNIRDNQYISFNI